MATTTVQRAALLILGVLAFLLYHLDGVAAGAVNHAHISFPPRIGPRVEQCLRIYQFYYKETCWPYLEQYPYYKAVRINGPLRNNDDIDGFEWFPPLRNINQQEQLCESGGVMAVYRYLLTQPTVCKYIGFASWRDSNKHDIGRPLALRGDIMDQFNNGTVELDGEVPAVSGWFTIDVNIAEHAEREHPRLMETWDNTLAQLAKPVFGDNAVIPEMPASQNATYFSTYLIFEYSHLRSFTMLLEAHSSAFQRVYRHQYLRHLDPDAYFNRRPTDKPLCPYDTSKYPADLCYAFMGERLVNLWMWANGIESAARIEFNGTLSSVWSHSKEERDFERNGTTLWTDDVIEKMYNAQWNEHRMWPYGEYPGYTPITHIYPGWKPYTHYSQLRKALSLKNVALMKQQQQKHWQQQQLQQLSNNSIISGGTAAWIMTLGVALMLYLLFLRREHELNSRLDYSAPISPRNARKDYIKTA